MTSRVYASLPCSGPAAAAGREVLRGAQLALESPTRRRIELIVLDSFGEDREAQAVANATRAAGDEHALAYLGDFHSSQVARTAPILGAVDLLQVAPVSTQVGVQGRSLVRLMPHDGVGAEAIAGWLVEAGARELLVVHDHDDDYGVPVGALCAEAAGARGIRVRSRPVWDQDERPADDVGAADAVLYVGVAGSGAAGLWAELHDLNQALWLLGSEGTAEPWLARQLEPAVAERTRFFVAPRAPLAFYGYEAMALVRDAVARGGDRATVTRAGRATHDRESILGRYSIEEGQATCTAYGRLAVVAGRLVWDNVP